MRPINSKGVTFIELMAGMAMLSTAILMVLIGIKFLNEMQRQRAILDAKRDMQVNLFQLAKDVHNAETIWSITPDTLVLRLFDVRKGYNINLNPTLFDDANLGTVTYSYVESANGTFMRRIADFNGDITQRLWLRNIVTKPDGAGKIFEAFPSDDNPVGVTVTIKFKTHFLHDVPPFTLQAVKRAWSS